MIRPVRIQDAEAICQIYNYYIKNSNYTFDTEPKELDQIQKQIEASIGKTPYFVEENDGKIDGFCYVHPWKAKAAYSKTFEVTVYLHPSALGKGLGKLMMMKLIQESKALGVHALIACITEENEKSFHLFESLGFKRVSCFTQVGQKFGRWLGVRDYELVLE